MPELKPMLPSFIPLEQWDRNGIGVRVMPGARTLNISMQRARKYVGRLPKQGCEVRFSACVRETGVSTVALVNSAGTYYLRFVSDDSPGRL